MDQEKVEAVARAVAPIRHEANAYGYKRPRLLVIDERIARAAISALPAPEPASEVVTQQSARIAELEAVIEWIDNELCDAAVADCECGVRWLNDRAAAEYLKEYPATEQAVGAVITKTRALLKEASDAE